MDFPFLEEFEKALEAWTDERFVSREDIKVLATFAVYLVNLLDAEGATFDGYSMNIGHPMSRLVVRGTIDGIPHVVFASARDSIGCMRIFLRKLQEDLLEWSPDRYRQ